MDYAKEVQAIFDKALAAPPQPALLVEIGKLIEQNPDVAKKVFSERQDLVDIIFNGLERMF